MIYNSGMPFFYKLHLRNIWGEKRISEVKQRWEEKNPQNSNTLWEKSISTSLI